jgi:DNA-binding MarR family transcriptional regulator
MGNGSLSAPDPAGLWYRFSVKCDRDMNAAIDKAAKAAGMSPTIFVQSHFETILNGEPVRASRPAGNARADVDLAKSLGITLTALRLYRAMDERADHLRNVAITNSKLAEVAGTARSRVPGLVASLKARNLVRVLERTSTQRPTRYHVYSIGDER